MSSASVIRKSLLTLQQGPATMFLGGTGCKRIGTRLAPPRMRPIIQFPYKRSSTHFSPKRREHD
jgi:hypothetical protein